MTGEQLMTLDIPEYKPQKNNIPKVSSKVVASIKVLSSEVETISESDMLAYLLGIALTHENIDKRIDATYKYLQVNRYYERSDSLETKQSRLAATGVMPTVSNNGKLPIAVEDSIKEYI